MVSKRTAASLLFALVLLLGCLAAAVLLSALRERRWQRQGDDLEAFLSDFSTRDKNQSLVETPAVGTPALLFEQGEGASYVEGAVDESRIFIVARKFPETGVVRWALEKRPYRVFRTAKERMVTQAEGILVIGGRAFVVRSLSLGGGIPRFDLWSTGPNGGEKVGSLELQVASDKIVQGTVQFAGTGKRYDVIIPRDHPNVTGLLQTIRAVRPLTRADALAMVKASYQNFTQAGG